MICEVCNEDMATHGLGNRNLCEPCYDQITGETRLALTARAEAAEKRVGELEARLSEAREVIEIQVGQVARACEQAEAAEERVAELESDSRNERALRAELDAVAGGIQGALNRFTQDGHEVSAMNCKFILDQIEHVLADTDATAKAYEASIREPLERQVAALRADHAIAVENSNGWRKRATDSKNINNQLRSSIAALVECLRFYARHEHWMALTDRSENSCLLIANGANHVNGNGWEEAEAAITETAQAAARHDAHVKAMALREAAEAVWTDSSGILLTLAEAAEKEAGNG